MKNDSQNAANNELLKGISVKDIPKYRRDAITFLVLCAFDSALAVYMGFLSYRAFLRDEMIWSMVVALFCVLDAAFGYENLRKFLTCVRLIKSIKLLKQYKEDHPEEYEEYKENHPEDF